MPVFERQFAVMAGGKIFHLDVFARRERLAFELDGAAFHGSQVQREADIRRDALLATVGIQVVRFSYRRLVSEPDAVRVEVLKIFGVASEIVVPSAALFGFRSEAGGTSICALPREARVGPAAEGGRRAEGFG